MEEEAHNSSLDLALPDWSGHIPLPYWGEALLRSEAFLPLVKARPGFAERRLEDKIHAPFKW